MQIQCPYCQKTIEVPGGGQFTCPHCRAVFAVDLEPQAPTAPATPPPLPTAPFTMPPPVAPPGMGGAGMGGAGMGGAGMGGAGMGGAGMGGAGMGGPQAPPPQAGGAVCAKHPLRPAADTCQRCGNFTCSLCVIPVAGGRYCPDCVDKLGGGIGGAVPWENERAQLGTFGAYWKTCKSALFEPDQFFQRMPAEGGINAPLGFIVLGQTVFGLIGLVLFGLIMTGLGAAAGGARGGAAQGAQVMVQLVCQAALLPVQAAIGALIGGAIYHLVVLVLGGVRGFETTFRVVAYGAGSTAPLAVIPGIGPLVGFFWAIAVTYYGFKHSQQMSSGRALIAALSPLIVGCCCAGGVGGLFAFAAAQSGGRGF